MNSHFQTLVDWVGSIVHGVPAPHELPSIHDAVWALAKKHRVQGILASRILQEGGPAQLMDDARYFWQLLALREEYYTKKCDALVDFLRKEGVVALPLKGVVLARSVYPKRGFRSFRDLDFLVRREDIVTIDRLLKGDGFYELKTKGPSLQSVFPQGSVVEAAVAGHEGLSYQKDDLNVEFHTSLLPQMLGEYPLDSVWENGFLSPEDFMVHLLFHTTRHHFLFGLRQLIDISLWAQKVRSFQVVENRLRSAGLLWLAYPAWKLTHEYFPQTLLPPFELKRPSVLAYTQMVRKSFDQMPERSARLAGSPIPFVFMAGRSLRAIQGSKVQKKYQTGKAQTWDTIVWKMARPLRLLWRHGPVLIEWIKLSMKTLIFS